MFDWLKSLVGIEPEPTEYTMLTMRRGLKGDLNDLLCIERLAMPFPWRIDDFYGVLKIPGASLRVVCVGKLVAGYVLYVNWRDSIDVKRLVVHPECRRRGIAVALLRSITNDLHPQRRWMAGAIVPHDNLRAQELMKAAGWRQVTEQVVVEWFRWPDGSASHGQVWEFKVPAPVECKGK